MDEQSIIDGLKPICRCQAIKKKAVLKLIEEGACTLEAIQQATGAGSGDCNGKQCTPRIKALLGDAPEK